MKELLKRFRTSGQGSKNISWRERGEIVRGWVDPRNWKNMIGVLREDTQVLMGMNMMDRSLAEVGAAAITFTALRIALAGTEAVKGCDGALMISMTAALLIIAEQTIPDLCDARIVRG